MRAALSRVAWIALLALSLSRCGHASEDDLTGTWTGSFKDTLAVFGGGKMTFSQSGSAVSGTWQVTFSTTSPYNNDGLIDGTFTGGSLSARLTSSHGGCPFQLTATRSGSRLSGTYAASDCAVAETGSLDLEKRP